MLPCQLLGARIAPPGGAAACQGLTCRRSTKPLTGSGAAVVANTLVAGKAHPACWMQAISTVAAQAAGQATALQQQPPHVQLTPPEAAAATGIRHEAALHPQARPLQQAHGREAVPVLAAGRFAAGVLNPVIHDSWAPGCHTAQRVQQVLRQPACEPLEGRHLCRVAAVQQLQAGRRRMS